MRLALDPGHGMGNTKPNVYDPGAVSELGEEASLVLDLASSVNWILKGDKLNTWMTRENATTNSPLRTRPSRAEAMDCTRYLSLHMNSFDGSATGIETYYRSTEDKVWASLVHQIALNAFELADRGLKPESDSQHSTLKVFDFDGPCCLCEVGFVDNERDVEVIMDRLRRIAFANGISGYLKGLLQR
jgi:N-acetylmuramoyl-L-alanine amidase